MGALAASLGVLACRSSLGQPAENAAYVGVETSSRTDRSAARFFSASGAPLRSVPLDFRAHGAARHGRKLVVFPRRPGDRFAVIDLSSFGVLAVQKAPDGRHFYGHGAFTRDGQYLLAPENDVQTLRGGIGVYDVSERIRRIGRLDLPGPGPHEIVREREADRFHIAVGGLETHPAYGRTPLNLHDFKSEIVSLTFSGGSLDRTGPWPGSSGVSLRHLALDDEGRMYVGGQVVREAERRAQNVLWLRQGDALRALDESRRLGGYVSSVAAFGGSAIVTSKEAGLAIRFEKAQAVERYRLAGASAAALGPGFVALSGFSELRLNDAVRSAAPHAEFDNHGMSLY